MDPSSSSQTSDEESKIHSRLQIHGKIRGYLLHKNDIFCVNIFFYFLLVCRRLAVFFFTNFQLLRDLGEKFLYLQTRQSVRQVIIIKTVSNNQWKKYIFSPFTSPFNRKQDRERVLTRPMIHSGLWCVSSFISGIFSIWSPLHSCNTHLVLTTFYPTLNVCCLHLMTQLSSQDL